MGRGVNAEVQLGFLGVVRGEALQEQGAEAGASTSTNGVEDQEALETGALVSQLADAIQSLVNEILADGVVTTSVVVGSILLSRNDLVRVEELLVLSVSDFISNRGLEINKDSARHVLARASLVEEGGEGILSLDTLGTSLVDSVLQAVELPAALADLATALTNVNGDDFTHV